MAKWNILFLFLGIWASSVGQESSFLVQEDRFESYTGLPGKSEISFRSQELYRYNQDGLVDRFIQNRCWKREEFDCNKQDQTFYYYDHKKRILSTKTDGFNHSSGELEAIIERHYHYNNDLDYLEFIETEYDFLTNNSKLKEFIHLNAEGKWLSSISSSTDENGYAYTVESNYQYNDEGCELSTEITGSGNIPGSENYYYIRSDYTYYKNCQLRTARHYEYRSDLRITALKFQEKWEYEWDSRGNAVIITEFRNLTEWDTTLVMFQNSEIHYDAEDRDTLRTTIVGDSISGTRYRTKYTEDGNITLRQIELWDTNYQQWILDYDHHTTFNDFGNVIHSLKYTDYDIESEMFQGYSEYRVEYNSAQQEVYTNSKSKSGEPGHFYEDEVETYLEYGCDGRFLRSESISLLHGHSNVSTKTYYDLPPCSVLPAENLNFILVPNPASDLVHLQFDQVIQDGLIQVFNPNGNLLISKKVGIGNFFYLDLTDLPAGPYIIQLQSGQNKMHQKLIKI